jgi:hypothetical protein
MVILPFPLSEISQPIPYFFEHVIIIGKPHQIKYFIHIILFWQ